MELDDAQTADLDAIIKLRHRAFKKLAPLHYSRIEVENLLNDYDRAQISEMIGDRRLFCYRNGQEICGTAGWECEAIRHVYVDPDLFGVGIGSKLIEHTILDFERRTGYKCVKAGVIIYARGFYEKLGFKVVAMKKAWDSSVFYEMSKPLK